MARASQGKPCRYGIAFFANQNGLETAERAPETPLGADRLIHEGMGRTLRILFLAATIAAFAFVFAGQNLPPSPEATVVAFAKAIEDHDFKAMAALVVRGNATFGYKELLGRDDRIKRIYAKVSVKTLDVSGTGIDAEWHGRVDHSYANGGGGGDDERVRLKLDHGNWRIVPPFSQHWAGVLAEYADLVARPDKIFAEREAALAPSRNRTERTIKLGMDRAKFFRQILSLPERGKPEDYPPYSGYKSMMMIEHTAVLWPIGRSDEVIFCMTYDGHPIALTCWRRSGEEPKRAWQARLPQGRSKSRKCVIGTLARWLAREGGRLPKRIPKDMARTLRAVRPYAAYQEIGAVSIFTCWVVLEDGSEKLGTAKHYTSDAITESDDQVRDEGFYITPGEVELLTPAASSRLPKRPSISPVGDHTFITDLWHLGELRSTFGEPADREDPATGIRSPIWSATNINYDTRQIFPIGRADERLYLNEIDPGGTAYLALESRHGDKVDKGWYITLRSVKERSSIPMKELRSMGTLEAFLAREGLQPLLPKNHAQAQRIRKVLKAKESYATYFTSAHMGGPMYCGHIDLDGTETPYWLVKQEDLQGTGNDYPVTGSPYRITEFEQDAIRSRNRLHSTATPS
ncbi:MAG TPA: hypothetical protein VMI31_01420 [Fimbriimonadaceae bacterium]|nr:hypothetical protein [Fimbriimonadaceae bacterium]